MISYNLYQNFKRLENVKFNHLTIIVTLSLTYKPRALQVRFMGVKWRQNLMSHVLIV